MFLTSQHPFPHWLLINSSLPLQALHRSRSLYPASSLIFYPSCFAQPASFLSQFYLFSPCSFKVLYNPTLFVQRVSGSSFPPQLFIWSLCSSPKSQSVPNPPILGVRSHCNGSRLHPPSSSNGFPCLSSPGLTIALIYCFLCGLFICPLFFREKNRILLHVAGMLTGRLTRARKREFLYFQSYFLTLHLGAAVTRTFFLNPYSSGLDHPLLLREDGTCTFGWAAGAVRDGKPESSEFSQRPGALEHHRCKVPRIFLLRVNIFP